MFNWPVKYLYLLKPTYFMLVIQLNAERVTYEKQKLVSPGLPLPSGSLAPGVTYIRQ